MTAGNVAIFCTLAFFSWKIDVVGQLPAYEIIFCAYFALSLLNPNLLFRDSFSNKFFMLGVFWLVCQVMIDLALGTVLSDAIRGWANIAVYVISLCTVTAWLTTGRSRNIVPIMLGVAVGTLAQIILFPDDYQSGDAWKFGGGVAAAFTVLTLLGYFRTAALPTLGMVGALAAISIAAGARSIAGVLFLAGIYCYMAFRMRTVTSARAVMTVLLVGGAGVFFLSEVYHLLLAAGFFSGALQEKFMSQEDSTYGTLLGGRSEMLVSLRAIWDAPWFGHGSWAQDRHYVEIYEQLLEANGQKDVHIESDLIPAHSHIFAAWVQGGVIGGLYWVITIFVVLRSAITTFRTRERYAALFLFCFLLDIWDILFSPLGVNNRLATAVSTGLALALLARERTRTISTLKGGYRLTPTEKPLMVGPRPRVDPSATSSAT